tara:strand:- start:1 stop:267 length:267 start_codon:yes stop_codon:yes gene_type:complete
MNIHNDNAGYVTRKHIESVGFEVFDTIEGTDMGQMDYSMPQYQNDKVKITGGYWNYIVKDIKTGQKLWEGWWNSNDEFDGTMSELKAI